MRIGLLAAVFCAAAALCGTAVAGLREDAASAYQRGDFTGAFQLRLSLAEEGDGSAQIMLGFMYHDGGSVSGAELQAQSLVF